MDLSKHLISLFIIFGLTARVTVCVWITYQGSHQNNLLIPSDIPHNVHDIYLNNNLLDKIDNRDLNFPSLVYLNLSHNVISSLSPEAFINVKQLKILDLSFNKILGSSLTIETFKKLESLELLVLKGNPLGIIKQDVFLPTYFSGVQYAMDFSECSIHTVEASSLVYLDRLTHLDLSKNHISELHPDTFIGLYSMDVLNLSHNSLNRVSTRMFHYLNMSVIDLSSNKISILEDGCFDKIKDMQFLNLSNNRLTTQPKDQFGDQFVAGIDLSENLFETFDTHLLSTKVRKHLRVLRITSSSKLKRIVAGKGDDGHPEGFENLEKLYLNDNSVLTIIEPAAFSSCSGSLQVAHMMNTMLERIPKGMLEWVNLTSYSVSTINFKCDCHASWMLDEVQIDRSKAQLTCITPPAYRGMNLFHISRDHLVCSSRQNLMLFVAIMVVVPLIAVIILFTYWLRRKKNCPACGRRHTKHGKYMSVYSKEVDEPLTRIIDEVADRDAAVDV